MANKKKVLKNVTGSPLTLDTFNLYIPAFDQITIEPSSYRLIADEIDIDGSLAALIRSGDIVVNDGIIDITVANGLNVERGIDYLKWPDTAFNIRFLSQPERMNGFAAKNVQEAIEEAKSAIEGKISVLPTFLNNGLTNNKWLSLDGSLGASDNLPAVTSYDSKLAGMTYINTNDGSNVDIEFYKNGIAPGNLLFTWQIRDKRSAWKTNGLDAFTFIRGDRISCFARAVTGTNARDVLVNLFVQSINSVVGEGGTASGI